MAMMERGVCSAMLQSAEKGGVNQPTAVLVLHRSAIDLGSGVVPI